METIETKSTNDKKMQNLPIVDPVDPNRKLTEKEEKWLREMVNYEFINIEEPGLMHQFTYGNTKNKHVFTLMHGEKYKLPRFIANHINTRSTPIWKWRPDGRGNMEKKQEGTKARFQLREVYT